MESTRLERLAKIKDRLVQLQAELNAVSSSLQALQENISQRIQTQRETRY